MDYPFIVCVYLHMQIYMGIIFTTESVHFVLNERAGEKVYHDRTSGKTFKICFPVLIYLIISVAHE